MIRNFKVLGLALVAVLAMSAMVASSASAAQFTATSGAKIEAKDTSNVKLTVTGQEVTCNSAVFTGTAPAAAFPSIGVNAAYNECKTGLGTNATVTGFGQHGEGGKCSFTLYAAGTADLNCPAGQEVTVDAATCIVHIPAQKGLGKLTYTNNGKHVDIGINVTGITGNHTDGFLCPFGSGGHSTAAVLESSSAVTAIPSVGTLSWDA